MSLYPVVPVRLPMAWGGQSLWQQLAATPDAANRREQLKATRPSKLSMDDVDEILQKSDSAVLSLRESLQRCFRRLS